MEEFLKGNFKTKNPIIFDDNEGVQKLTLNEELRKRTLASLGGSTVYVERNQLIWEGDG